MMSTYKNPPTKTNKEKKKQQNLQYTPLPAKTTEIEKAIALLLALKMISS